MAFRDITDGLSNTIMYGEIKTDLGDFDINTMPVSAAAINQVPTSGGNAGDPKVRPSDGNLGVDLARPAFWAPEVQAYVIAFGDPGDSTEASSAPEQRRGLKWACAQASHTVMHTILPPNGPTWAASDDTRRSDMVASAGSRHQGGCHLLMADGAVTFITDSIDTGNQNAGTVFVTDAGLQGAGASPVGSASPYGVWGAMGTRASKEVIGEDAFGQ
jgi:prepilin-type processing-associated H-X9-DG protein